MHIIVNFDNFEIKMIQKSLYTISMPINLSYYIFVECNQTCSNDLERVDPKTCSCVCKFGSTGSPLLLLLLFNIFI